MDNATNVTPTIVRIKREAKRIKKEKGCIHTRALDFAVQAHGFSNYRHYLNASRQPAAAAPEVSHG